MSTNENPAGADGGASEGRSLGLLNAPEVKPSPDNSVTIGPDTTAPIVVPCDAPAKQPHKAARLPKAAQTAMRALAEAINNHGAQPPSNGHIPHDVKVVTIDEWRQAAYRLGISASDTTDRAKRAAFKRASDYLIGDQRVGFSDGNVWLP